MKNKTIIILTSFLCLLPIILSLILYRSLPDDIAIHWDNAGEANSYIPKALAAFGLPVLFLIVNIYSKTRLLYEPKHENHSKVIRTISIWAIPGLSLVIVPITLFIALGIEIPVITISALIAGGLFIILGNHLPKSRQNYVMGIKLPWTLYNVDNWNKTNRLAGYMLMAGGIAILVSGFIPVIGTILGISLMVIIAALTLFVPLMYSYYLYKKEQSNLHLK